MFAAFSREIDLNIVSNIKVQKPSTSFQTIEIISFMTCREMLLPCQLKPYDLRISPQIEVGYIVM